MKYILSFVSFVFGIIFFNFYLIDNPNNIFGIKMNNLFHLNYFISNILIYTIVFFILAIFYFIYFSEQIKQKLIKIENLNKLIFILSLLLFYFYKKVITNNYLFFIGFSFFIIFLISYSFLLYINKYRKKIKIIGLISNYLSNIFLIIYSIKFNINFFIFIVFIYSIYFNYYINKKYGNLVSLAFSLIITVFLIYFLYFLINELYISYILLG